MRFYRVIGKIHLRSRNLIDCGWEPELTRFAVENFNQSDCKGKQRMQVGGNTECNI